jgi:hypothetical protein
MQVDADLKPLATSRRPPWLIVLAGRSFLLFIITGPEQLYYVLYTINPQVFGIGPHTNVFGALWYNYVQQGDNRYTHFDPGLATGAIEDAFMLAPLYLITGIGLIRQAGWVVAVGLLTAGMIWYAIVYVIFTSTLGAKQRDEWCHVLGTAGILCRLSYLAGVDAHLPPAALRTSVAPAAG